MNSGGLLTNILVERERLLQRCEAQRIELDALAGHWQRPLGMVDNAIGVVRYFQARPALVAFGVALLIALRHRGLWGWVRRGYALWRTYRALGRFRFGG